MMNSSRSWPGRRVGFAAQVAACSLLLVAPAAFAGDSADSPPLAGRQLFERNCGACHTLDKVTSQRPDRDGWNWVMDDMVSYGLTWLSPEEREKIVDHLVENYGRDTPG